MPCLEVEIVRLFLESLLRKFLFFDGKYTEFTVKSSLVVPATGRLNNVNMVMIIAKIEMNNNLHSKRADLKYKHSVVTETFKFIITIENKSHDQIQERLCSVC